MTSPSVRTVQLDEALFRTDCPNGLAVVTERLPALRSAAAGIWLRTASGHETRARMGVSHLLEHMVFKGTRQRTAREIATALEVRGGSLDAFTSRDNTAFQAHVIDSDLPLALDVLTDLVRHPLLRESDLALERNVVLEELNGVLDSPDDLVGELWGETIWPDHPYGYSILGTAESVRALTAQDLEATHRAGYYPGNAVIAIAGNIDHDDVMATLDKLGWNEGAARNALAPVAAGQAARGVLRTELRDSQQVHAIIGTDTVGAADPRRWGLALLTSVLGGGMSSRLFQRVREELGLCYAISAWHSTYRAAGVFGVYVGTQPGTAERALDAIDEELARVGREGLPASDLADAKGQIRGQVLLALESVTSRMGRLAVHILNDEPYRSIDQVLGLIDAVTAEETARLGADFLMPDRMTTVRLGPASVAA
ncbi:MAG TPA: pitrilysin family protein [Gemmatimonadales bacterium]|jgi:predicted Zn-dependent peptidase|nr:pitrilysin family protein [Gemmatimonadales bacterium]